MTQAAVQYDVFQAIADPTRRNVLQLLAKSDRPISNIAEHFAISRTAVVKHLKILEQAQLVSAQKKGREKIYTLHTERLKEVENWLQYFDLFWDNKLAQLQNLVENH
ncbi:metalloregulator ArsR/SmtB family transcription factor [Lysinibacillus sp. FSL K6-0232]|uniref:ArsR/SmtB family transcription factor n=1 Tax=unclassified Lysinibacillus TaxID=2636778 RepID=UPI0030F886F9